MKRLIMYVILIFVCDLFNYIKLINIVYVYCYIFRNCILIIKIIYLLIKGYQGVIKIENNIIVMIIFKCINCINLYILCWFSQL